MATSLKTNTNYRTTVLASVYSSDGISLNYVGTMPAGRTIQFYEIKSIQKKIYGKILNTNNPTYVSKTTGKSVSAAGYFICADQVVENNTSTGAASTTATTNTGSTTSIGNITILDSPMKFVVRTGYSWRCYNGPSPVGYSLVKTYPAGTTITIYATVKDNGGNVWGCPSTAINMWGTLYGSTGVQTSALTSQQTPQTTQATPATQLTTGNVTSSGSVTDAASDTYADMKAVNDVINEAASNMSFTDVEALEALHKMQWVIGIPPKITPTADIRYMQNVSPSNNFGRCYTEMFMMGNTVFSIQPCKVKYLPGFNEDEKNSFWNQVTSKLTGLGEDEGLNDAGNIGLTGQLFEAQPDYNDYINTVNMLARAMAIYLGIGDKYYMNTSTKYKHMDYSYYKIQKSNGRSRNGIFGAVADTVRATLASPVASAINDDTYLHFYMTADGTSVNENMQVSTRQSGLESLFNNNLSEIAQEIQFLGGTAAGIDFQSAIDDATSNLNGVASSMGTTIGNIVRYGGNYLKGGRLVFPQMLDDCTYDRSYSGTCRFLSASGDPEAIFMNCYLPLCYILPYVLPQMLSDNMYRYPFLARVNAKGLYHCDLAAITGLRIQRGGQDGTCFTADGLPFEIDVSFDVTPLYSKLMVTSARHPVLFLSNSALQEYLGAMCGVSFTGDQLQLKLNILRAITGNYLTDTAPSMLRGYYSSNVANWLRKLFNF